MDYNQVGYVNRWYTPTYHHEPSRTPVGRLPHQLFRLQPTVGCPFGHSSGGCGLQGGRGWGPLKGWWLWTKSLCRTRGGFRYVLCSPLLAKTKRRLNVKRNEDYIPDLRPRATALCTAVAKVNVCEYYVLALALCFRMFFTTVEQCTLASAKFGVNKTIPFLVSYFDFPYNPQPRSDAILAEPWLAIRESYWHWSHWWVRCSSDVPQSLQQVIQELLSQTWSTVLTAGQKPTITYVFGT